MSFSKRNPNNTNSGCFFSIFGRFNCGGNQPTHPSPPEGIPEKSSNSTKDDNVSNNNCSDKIGAVVVRSKSNPGIVARLMGLDTLPDCNTASKPPLSINDSLSRSKSLNSLHFVLDFNPTKPSFHRRVRTLLSASFQEPGNGFLSTIVENSEIDGDQMKNIVNKGRNETTQKKTSIEKAVVSKGNECQKTRKSSEIKKNYHQEHYYRGNCITCRTKTSNKLVKNTSVIRENVGSNNTKKNNNSSRKKCGNQRSKLVVNNINKDKNVKISSTSVSRKNKGGDNDVQSDDVQLSRSPISVLDHHQLEFDSPSREDTNATQTTSNLRSRSTPKPDTPPQEIERKSRKKDHDNFTNNIASKNKAATEEDAEYFDNNLSSKICALAEDQLCKDLTSHVTKYDLFKAHFIEELCNDFGQHMLDFLLDELICEHRCLC